MERLANLIINMENNGFLKCLRTVQNFSQLFLSKDFTIRQWATDRKFNINRDLQRLILTAASSAPYIEELLDEKQLSELMEFTFEDEPCLGLGLAALRETGALSLDGDTRFTMPSIPIHCLHSDGERLQRKTFAVPSVYDVGSAKAFFNWYHAGVLKKVKTPAKLLELRAYLFPCLRFNTNVRKQLEEMTGAEPFFSVIINHLDKLNKAMQEWKAGPFRPQGLDWSTESESAMNQYSRERTFVCDDGITRIFTCHSKLHGANVRIYFFPQPELHTVHIGYIGAHLPTARIRA